MKNKKFSCNGGTSGENLSVLIAAKFKAQKKGYKVSYYDPHKKPLNLIDKNKTDIIFNALHGKYGEDGVAQSYFEFLKIPYTHSGIMSSYNAMDKIISKNIQTAWYCLPKFFSFKPRV